SGRMPGSLNVASSTLTLASSICAASHSVVTRGSVVVMRSSTLLLRLPLLDGAAGIAPACKAAAHVSDRLQAHVLCGLGRERRTHAAGAVEDELLVLLEHRLGIGALRIDPELQHAAGAGEGAGNPAVALDLAGIADVDDDDVIVRGELD